MLVFPSSIVCNQDQGILPWSPRSTPVETGLPHHQQQNETLTIPSSLSLYLAEIGTIPLLTPEQEHTLALRVQQGDEQAKRHLLEANLRLVVHVAKQYGHGDLTLLDHIQNGFFGLLKAVERFDPTRNLHLSTYAIWWIRQAITRAQHNTARLIRLPIYLQTQLHAMDQASDAWFLAHGTEATREHLATTLALSLDHIQMLQAMRERTLSLDWSYDPCHEDGPTLADLLEDRESIAPCDQVSNQDAYEIMRHTVQQALTLLTERERQVVTLHFGLEDDGEAIDSYAEIGRHIGICRERVRQLLSSALEKLKGAPMLQSLVRDTEHAMVSGWDWDGDEDNEGIAEQQESIPHEERSIP